MRKIITTLCTLAMSLSLFGCTAGLTDNPNYNASASQEDTSKEKTVLRIGMECDYAPNNWQEDTATDTNLPISNLSGFYAEGYDIQMSKLLAEKMDGITVELLEGIDAVPGDDEEFLDMLKDKLPMFSASRACTRRVFVHFLCQWARSVIQRRDKNTLLIGTFEGEIETFFNNADISAINAPIVIVIITYIFNCSIFLEPANSSIINADK